MKRSCYGVLLLLSLSVACATSGRPIESDRVSQIELNITSQDEIQEWFGEPTGTRLRAKRGSTWIYAYKRAKGVDTGLLSRLAKDAAEIAGSPIKGGRTPVGAKLGRSNQQILKVDFDLDGIVVDFAYADGTNDNSRIR